MSQEELIERAEIERAQAEMEGVQVAWDDEVIDYPHEEENYRDFKPDYLYFDSEADADFVF